MKSEFMEDLPTCPPAPPAPQPPAAQQQLVNTGGKTGLKRSRQEQAECPQQKSSKKQKSWVHDASTQQLGQGGKVIALLCTFGCKEPISSNVTRAKAHLLACKPFLVSEKVQDLAPKDPKLRAHVDRRLQQQQQQQQPGARMRQASLTAASCNCSDSGSFIKLWPIMSNEDYKAAANAIAKAFFTCNLRHSLVEKPTFAGMLTHLAPWMENRLPSRKQLAGPLLEEVYQEYRARVDDFLKEQEFVAASTDAWSNQQGAHVLNLNATANGTSVYLGMIFSGAESHTNEYIAAMMEGMLKDWGATDKVVACVTDWGSNMLKAGGNLLERLPNMLASVGCIQHLLSLVLQDYGVVPCLEELLDKVKTIVKYITSHTVLHALYIAKKEEQKGTALIKECATRFGSKLLSANSLLENEKVLRAVVNSKEYALHCQAQRGANKYAAIEVKGLIADTESTLFSELAWRRFNRRSRSWRATQPSCRMRTSPSGRSTTT